MVYEREIKFMKNILVTGADGFIGKRLVKRLYELGFTVFEHNISDGDITTASFDFENISHVFHLAAMTFVPDSWKNPNEFYRVNVMGTENVLEFCRKNKISLTIPSTYVYGVPEYMPIPENHKINPNTPYNHSKVLAESLCEFYSKAFGMDIVVFRPFNIYGAGQSGQFIIPKIVSQVMDPEISEIEVMDLAPKRDYLYIDDLINAFILSINKEGYNVYNLASGKSYSVEEIILLSEQILGVNKPYKSVGQQRQGEVFDIVADISKIKTELNFVPQFDFYNGLKNMIDEIKSSKLN